MNAMVAELKTIEPREIFPGFLGRFIHTPHMTFAYWEIKKDSIVPAHGHVHEQVVNMLEGEFELVVSGVAHQLSPGLIVAIPSHAIHSGKAITDCKILDVFYPVREDYK